MVMIKLIWWCLYLLDAPWHQLTRMHACEAAARLAMVDCHWMGMCSAHGEKDAAWHNARRRLVCPLRLGSLQTNKCPMCGGYYTDYYSSDTPQIKELSSREAC